MVGGEFCGLRYGMRSYRAEGEGSPEPRAIGTVVRTLTSSQIHTQLWLGTEKMQDCMDELTGWVNPAR